MKILVSACLLGLSCRYDGTSKPCEAVIDLGETHTLIPFCPECYGGLATPRAPAEIVDGRVINKDGQDVTAQYQKGAAEALLLYQRLGCDCALLKEKSPSCGHGQVYDGTFQGRLIEGDGVTTALLLQHGIPVYGESQAEMLAKITE